MQKLQFDFHREPFRFYSRLRSEEREIDHFHVHNGLELLYIHEGDATVRLRGRDTRVGGRTLLLFPPLRQHRLSIRAGADRPYVRTVMLLEPTLLQAYLQPFPRLGRLFQRLCRGEAGELALRDEPLVGRAESLLAHYLERGEGPPDRERQVLLLLSLLELLSDVPELGKEEADAAAMPPDSRHVQAIVAWIEEHYKESVRLDRMAEALHLSPYYISHLFRKETGYTVMSYVTERRIQEAGFLLRTEGCTIKEAAFRSGFASPSAFAKAFKAKFGVTPQQYRGAKLPPQP